MNNIVISLDIMNIRNIFKNSCENGSKVLSLEQLHPHKNYAITINPQQLGNEMKLLNMHNSVWNNLNLFHGNLVLYTELSTKSQNVHYHGFINWNTYKDIVQFYLSIDEIKKDNQIEIDHLTDLDQWWPYVTKQCPHMDAICHWQKTSNKIKYNYIKDKNKIK